MTYLEAALIVLEAAGRSLTVREITEEALGRGLIVATGKTPLQTMASTLYLYRKQHEVGRLAYHAEHGSQRAIRGSVRWSLRNS